MTYKQILRWCAENRIEFGPKLDALPLHVLERLRTNLLPCYAAEIMNPSRPSDHIEGFATVTMKWLTAAIKEKAAPDSVVVQELDSQ